MYSSLAISMPAFRRRAAGIFFAVAAVLMPACGSENQAAEPTAADSADAQAPIPLPGGQVGEPAVGDTVRGLSGPYVDRGVCPFECCTYTEWRAKEELTVFARERDTTDVAFTIPAGERFTGVTGNVHLDPPGLVVLNDTLTTYGGERFMAGDTVYVLSHVGEGHFNVVHDGERMQVEGFWTDNTAYGQPPPRGTLIREPRPQWWAQVRDGQGRTGWLFMDRIGGKVGGLDACGGPDA